MQPYSKNTYFQIILYILEYTKKCQKMYLLKHFSKYIYANLISTKVFLVIFVFCWKYINKCINIFFKSI